MRQLLNSLRGILLPIGAILVALFISGLILLLAAPLAQAGELDPADDAAPPAHAVGPVTVTATRAALRDRNAVTLPHELRD